MFQYLLSRFVFCNPAYSLTHTQLWANQWERRMISRFHLLSRSPSKTKDTIHIRFTLNARKCTRLTVVICGLVTNDIYWTAIYLDFPNHWSVLIFFSVNVDSSFFSNRLTIDKLVIADKQSHTHTYRYIWNEDHNFNTFCIQGKDNESPLNVFVSNAHTRKKEYRWIWAAHSVKGHQTQAWHQTVYDDDDADI